MIRVATTVADLDEFHGIAAAGDRTAMCGTPDRPHPSRGDVDRWADDDEVTLLIYDDPVGTARGVGVYHDAGGPLFSYAERDVWVDAIGEMLAWVKADTGRAAGGTPDTEWPAEQIANVPGVEVDPDGGWRLT